MLKKILFILFLVLPLTNTVYAQLTIGKPTFPFPQICASPSYNEYEINFSFSPETALNNDNKFVVELSTPEGSFTTPTVVYTSLAGEFKVSPVKIIIAVPENTAGENYKFRIKSTSPASTSATSNSFPAYYKLQDSQFTINNLIPTATYCAGGSFILSIDNPGSASNDSPLKYSSLTYNWYKDNGLVLPPTLITSESTGSYSVTAPGKYYVETNYGSCTSNSYSNRVEVFESSTAASATITSSAGNPFCSISGTTILSTAAGNSYEWSKDGKVIPGANSQTYEASSVGIYSVKVDYGNCQASANINLQGVSINSSLNVEDQTIIEPGESVDVSVTTDATNPSFKWYKENVVIKDATSNSLSVKSIGNYKVVVTEQGECTLVDELPFTVKFDSDINPFPDVAEIPNIISPNGDFINDTWIIPQEFANQPDVEVMIISAFGEKILETTNYQNDWPSNTIDFKNINPVYYYIINKNGKMKKGSITVIK